MSVRTKKNFSNAIAKVIETKVISCEKGVHPGWRSKITINEHGHPKIIKNVTENNRYVGWGTITQTTEGELLVVYSGDRDSHICPWGKTQLIRSRDNGKTWSLPHTITNTPLDDRDAGIIQTRNGTLLVSWFTSLYFAQQVTSSNGEELNIASVLYARHSEKISQKTRDKWLGYWVKRSIDGGQNWQTPVRTNSSAPHGPIQLRDGRLLYIGNDRTKGEINITFEQSDDDGRTWSVIAAIPAGFDGYEPHVVELESGKILAMFRSGAPDESQRFLMQSESYDGGKTWTDIHSSGIWGYPPHLLKLHNGWVAVVYGYRREPYGERACISYDEGKTWDIKNEIILASAPGPDLGYPSSVQLNDGSILTIYYQAEKVGVPTCIMSTRWKLKTP